MEHIRQSSPQRRPRPDKRLRLLGLSVVAGLLSHSPIARADDALDVKGGFFEKGMVNKGLFDGIEESGRQRRNLSQGIEDYNHGPRHSRRRNRRSSDTFAISTTDAAAALSAVQSLDSEGAPPPTAKQRGLDIIPNISAAPTAPVPPASQNRRGSQAPVQHAEPAAEPEPAAEAVPAVDPAEAANLAGRIANGTAPVAQPPAGSPEYTQQVIDRVIRQSTEQAPAAQPAPGGGDWREESERRREGSGSSRF